MFLNDNDTFSGSAQETKHTVENENCKKCTFWQRMNQVFT